MQVSKFWRGTSLGANFAYSIFTGLMTIISLQILFPGISILIIALVTIANIAICNLNNFIVIFESTTTAKRFKKALNKYPSLKFLIALLSILYTAAIACYCFASLAACQPN